MLLRIIILIVLCVVMYLAYRLVTKWQLSRTGQSKDVDPLLSEMNLLIPTIVYFTTPMCAVCRTTQGPAFERLQTKMENQVNIIKVDATVDPDSSKRWGVLSVPTTFVLDRDGKPVKVNNGFVDEGKLSDQLQLAHGSA